MNLGGPADMVSTTVHAPRGQPLQPDMIDHNPVAFLRRSLIDAEERLCAG